MDSSHRCASDRLERLEKEFSATLKSSMTTLESIWKNVGITEDQKNKRERTMLLHFQNLLKDMVAEEEHLKSSLQKKNEECHKEVDQLCVDLALPLFQLSKDLDLLHEKVQLKEKHEQLTKDKENILESLRSLRLHEEILCKRLALPQHELNFVGCPNAEQLKELEQNVTFLNLELEKRSALFLKLRACIIRFWEDLEHDPTDEIELQLARSDASSEFTLSSANLDALDELQNKLELKYKLLVEEIHALHAHVKCLWNRLEISEEEKECFANKCVGYSPNVAKALSKELQRLEQLKKEHMETFVNGIRKELNQLWDKCFFGEEQRKEFQPAFSDVFTDESLAAHEHQCLIMKSFLEENKAMFKKVEKREGIWKKKVEFENKETDSNRLNNRGGALLKEEKIRKLLDKELPKVEQELTALIATWESEHETYFIVNGARYLDTIHNQKDEFEQQKEEKRLMRQQAKHDTLQGDLSRVTTPQKRRFAGTPVRAAAKHRKVDITFTPGKFIHSSICPSPRSTKPSSKENNELLANLTTTPKAAPRNAAKNKKARRSARLRTSRCTVADKKATGRGASTTRRVATPGRVPQCTTHLKDPVKDVSLISYSDFVGGVACDGRSSFLAGGTKTPKTANEF